MKEVIERFSSSSSDAVHEVTSPGDGGVVWCSCMGWKMNKLQPKQCSHMLKLVKAGRLNADFTPAGGTPVVATPVAVVQATAARVAAESPAPKAMLAYDIGSAKCAPWGNEEWVAELKIDGMRLFHVVTADGQKAQYARSGMQRDLAWLNEMPIPNDTILDGEFAAAEIGTWAQGKTSNTLFVFDVLRLGGIDMTGQSWTVRRAAVEMLVEAVGSDQLKVSTVLGTPDVAMVDAVFSQGGEGVMLKRRAGTYAPGKRSWDWIKAKGMTTYDVIVMDDAGLCTEERMAAGWGNLRYGVYIEGKLTLIGSLGRTGPKPELQQFIGKVVEVKGYGQSASGAIRHPHMLGIREDKKPEDCVVGA